MIDLEKIESKTDTGGGEECSHKELFHASLIVTVNKDFVQYYHEHPMRRGKRGAYGTASSL